MCNGGRPIVPVCAKTILHKNGGHRPSRRGFLSGVPSAASLLMAACTQNQEPAPTPHADVTLRIVLANIAKDHTVSTTATTAPWRDQSSAYAKAFGAAIRGGWAPAQR